MLNKLIVELSRSLDKVENLTLGSSVEVEFPCSKLHEGDLVLRRVVGDVMEDGVQLPLAEPPLSLRPHMLDGDLVSPLLVLDE